ncbi:probable membrane-associated kinase regulator 1 [Salvia hispanica]|uniref:probable membrane-associated kinase regulator 1 n=1 Tax=Salvia hispanica TaxID=49212 RepID=UPI002009CBC1|nr:probable membrane-associated kinase regulator 1 [Salvia hispanica]
MGRRQRSKSHTLPSSPTYSSSSSEFEFRISLSPHKSSRPADELFYKGQILPLHLSPRLSMVQSLLLLSSSPSSSSASTSRDSTASSDLLLDSDSSRPSSATDDDFIKRPSTDRKSPKYFSLAKFSSKTTSSVKRVSTTARGVLRKYFNKVKPLYEKLSHKQQQQQQQHKMPAPEVARRSNENSREFSMSFSGNLRYPRRRSSISSCPSSMTSSPRRAEAAQMGRVGSGSYNPGASSMAELQSAIQGAIAHCKNSMLKNNNAVKVEQILVDRCGNK